MSLETVRTYYGEVLRSSADLATDACVTAASPSPSVAAALADVHPEVRARYYGCGLVAPEALGGARVLDLGCGAGQDVYVLAKLVGARGSVVGVDATPAQLAVARAHQDWHAERHGYAESNVTFLDGDIADLPALALEPASFDVVVSNCVFNLVEDKPAVFRAAHALLKPGGELYFSDVYADRRLPAALKADPVVLGECLGGALYWNDFLAMARSAGFADPRRVAGRPLGVRDAAIAAKVAPARFVSATCRLFKIDQLEPACEDYGQAVRYEGGVPGAGETLTLDDGHAFARGRIMPVCGNTWLMLHESRFAPYFRFFGDFSTHFGVFEGCEMTAPGAWTDPDAEAGPAGCC